MPTYHTPNVYVDEPSAFPPSIVEVGTSVPAFIGHTEKATKSVAGDLLGVAMRITSVKEYERYFGAAEAEPIAIAVSGDANIGFHVASIRISNRDTSTAALTSNAILPAHFLYHAVTMFFVNGGVACYIVSVGDYHAPLTIGHAAPAATGILGALNALQSEPEPALVSIPEAVLLSAVDYTTMVAALLSHCEQMGNRFAILDARDGAVELHRTNPDGSGSFLDATRRTVGVANLEFGALYYPFLRTAVPPVVNTNAPSNVTVTYQSGAASVVLESSLDILANTNNALFNFVVDAIKNHTVVIPPSAVVAGAYAEIDSTRGVWNAPANFGLSGIVNPVVPINNVQQSDLNVDVVEGKSINVIRTFPGRGTVIWGARTLLGNDNEWRYVSVRRFFSMIEQSIRNSTQWVVFEPNDANTWGRVRAMIENYLTQKWRDGALMGTKPNDAFFVRCGLGQTMTAQDILDGRLIVEVGMAAARPAEFVVLRFLHRLQSE